MHILWQKIIDLVQNNQSFVITSHLNPDCDALGSELALAEHLRNLGKDVTIINSDSMPKNYRFLDPKRRVKRYSSKRHGPIIDKADVLVVLDASGGWDRLGQVGKAFDQANVTKICIDHHPDSVDFVDIAVIDTEAAATAEMIYDLVMTMGGSVSKPMAQALYAAVITDTGNFRFPKTSPKTHHITAELLVAGANPSTIYRQIYEQNLLGSVRLKGHMMDSIQTTANGQIAYYSLTQKTLKAYGVKTSDLDGFASLGQLVGGVRIVVFCSEASKGRTKISLRSDGTVAINQLAQMYQGGGHPSAAGAITPGKLDEILAEVVDKACNLLENEQNG